MKTATIFALLYGDYADLHLRLLEGLKSTVSLEKADVRLWLNTVCDRTKQWLEQNNPGWMVVDSHENIPKYVVMRKLFHDPDCPITTPWVIWFDDDICFSAPDWFDATVKFIEEKVTAGAAVDLLGHTYIRGHRVGIEQFIAQSKWHTGRTSQCLSNSRWAGKGIRFVQGSYWWLRTLSMRKLDWPDPRLRHNGGDTLLSEAVYQQFMGQADFYYGIVTNAAPRRGLSEIPAGERTWPKKRKHAPPMNAPDPLAALSLARRAQAVRDAKRRKLEQAAADKYRMQSKQSVRPAVPPKMTP